MPVKCQGEPFTPHALRSSPVEQLPNYDVELRAAGVWSPCIACGRSLSPRGRRGRDLRGARCAASGPQPPVLGSSVERRTRHMPPTPRLRAALLLALLCGLCAFADAGRHARSEGSLRPLANASVAAPPFQAAFSAPSKARVDTSRLLTKYSLNDTNAVCNDGSPGTLRGTRAPHTVPRFAAAHPPR